MITFYFFLVILLCALYKLVYQPLVYWKKRNLPFETPFPIVGNLGSVILKRKSFFDNFKDIYERNKKHRCVGLFQMTTPTLLINDLELIKQVTVKHFDHFVDHRMLSDPKVEILLSKNLFALNGQEWKEMRRLQSPAFSGTKMKLMSGLMVDCARKFTAHFEKVVLAEKSGKVFEIEEASNPPCELKLRTLYTIDVIASCAYGLECDTLKDPNNQFYTIGKDATNIRGLRKVVAMLINFMPILTKLFNLRLFPQKFSDFFIGTIKETIKYRNENQVTRPDMIQLLMDARKGKLRHEEKSETDKGTDTGFAVVEESEVGKADIRKTSADRLTDEDIAAQAFIFFLAGFDNVGIQLALIVTELAICPDVQEKLYQEVKEVMTKCNGHPTYETIIGMKYLDMVLSESLRKWPQAIVLDRKCTKDFTIKSDDGSSDDIRVKVGEIVVISLAGLHRDPQYFPNPTKFDPERFNDENKHKIVPYSYIPFGMGPRACIGSRFAILEIKLLLVFFLNRFQFEVVDKTVVPITVSKAKLSIEPEGGFWLGLKVRKDI